MMNQRGLGVATVNSCSRKSGRSQCPHQCGALGFVSRHLQQRARCLSNRMRRLYALLGVLKSSLTSSAVRWRPRK
jgi:hypothetical protein